MNHQLSYENNLYIDVYHSYQYVDVNSDINANNPIIKKCHKNYMDNFLGMCVLILTKVHKNDNRKTCKMHAGMFMREQYSRHVYLHINIHPKTRHLY